MLKFVMTLIHGLVIRPWRVLAGLLSRRGRPQETTHSIRSPQLRTILEAELAEHKPPSSRPAETTKEGPYSVTVIDNFNRHDPDETFAVRGFATRALAEEYAVRRVRSSIEQFRKEASGPADLRSRWNALGEEVVVDGRRIGLSRFDEFAATPASKQECDYLTLQPSKR